MFQLRKSGEINTGQIPKDGIIATTILDIGTAVMIAHAGTRVIPKTVLTVIAMLVMIPGVRESRSPTR